jgi:hypothetical protein
MENELTLILTKCTLDKTRFAKVTGDNGAARLVA